MVILAISLTHLFPPKHHARALRIIDDVLREDTDNISCLMSRGYILQHVKKWEEAATLFAQIAQVIPEDLDDGLRAKEEHAWCLSRAGDPSGCVALLTQILETLEGIEGREADAARCQWRIGVSYWDMGGAHSSYSRRILAEAATIGDKREDSYPCFIKSLKRNSLFAPAFTSLGIYYLDCADPPDPVRASKCFQKAFELDARESEAARRLAEGFAEEREWDLVEVVARRTIEGEGGFGGGLGNDATAPSTRYLPANAWAWKALGAVELVSITSSRFVIS